MRKYMFILFMSGIILGGCSSKPINWDPSIEINDSDETTEHFEVNFSLMCDQSTQDEIAALLKEEGVSEENIETFFGYINDFNELMGAMKSSQPGFQTGNILGQLFDYGYIYDTWVTNRTYSDLNCRLTAFTLMKDLITVNTSILVEPNQDNFIEVDMAVLKEIPLIQFSDEELKKYYNFYSAIPTVDSIDKAVLLESIQKEWEKRGVQFEMNDEISLISIFLHDPESKTLYVGHTGVLIQTDTGYLFLEKVAPLDVFMATKHKTLEDFEAYLEVLYGNMIISEGSSPLFLLNDQLLNK